MLLIIFFYTVLIIFTGIISIKTGGKKSAGRNIFPAVCILSSLALLLIIVTGYNTFADQIYSLDWQLPFAEFKIGIDYISLFFLIPLLFLTSVCSAYGIRYFKGSGAGRMHWFSYSLLASGMVMVLLSRNAVLFIISWEIMSFSSFLLVITDYEDKKVRRAGWIYFATAHVGTAFLFTAFFLLSSCSGSFDFNAFRLFSFPVDKMNLIFITALIGFGLKAGFIPFHIWLPLAHPAAPSHVSALMSGIMIKMGIYGIIRIILFLAPLQLWWGVTLIILGSFSGILGILFASGQHDIKRLLAFSSVENIGIILLGLGMGITGKIYNNEIVSIFGFAGAFLHIFNHALYKGLLFLCAGAVIRQTGTGEIDRLGGLFKKMPWTGYLFLSGSIAISGLPFFSGFISEIFIYISSVTGAVKGSDSFLPMVSSVTVISLAAVGGLSSLCFSKVFGVVFQGLPRKTDLSPVEKAPLVMRISMLVLAFFTLLTGLASFALLPFLEKPVSVFTGNITAPYFSMLEDNLVTVSLVLSVSLVFILVISALKRRIYRKRFKNIRETWGCGYLFPSSKMQYTASSYADAAVDKFKGITALSREKNFTEELFPEKNWSFSSGVDDWFLSGIYVRAVKAADRILSLLRWFQCGKAGVYVLYAALTVVVLIIWKFVLC